MLNRINAFPPFYMNGWLTGRLLTKTAEISTSRNIISCDWTRPPPQVVSLLVLASLTESHSVLSLTLTNSKYWIIALVL